MRGFYRSGVLASQDTPYGDTAIHALSHTQEKAPMPGEDGGLAPTLIEEAP